MFHGTVKCLFLVFVNGERPLKERLAVDEHCFTRSDPRLRLPRFSFWVNIVFCEQNVRPLLCTDGDATGKNGLPYHEPNATIYISMLWCVSVVSMKHAKVIEFMERHFPGSEMREKQNAKMRFEFPPQEQESQTLAQMFGFIEVT